MDASMHALKKKRNACMKAACETSRQIRPRDPNLIEADFFPFLLKNGNVLFSFIE